MVFDRVTKFFATKFSPLKTQDSSPPPDRFKSSFVILSAVSLPPTPTMIDQSADYSKSSSSSSPLPSSPETVPLNILKPEPLQPSLPPPEIPRQCDLMVMPCFDTLDTIDLIDFVDDDDEPKFKVNQTKDVDVSLEELFGIKLTTTATFHSSTSTADQPIPYWKCSEPKHVELGYVKYKANHHKKSNQDDQLQFPSLPSSVGKSLFAQLVTHEPEQIYCGSFLQRLMGQDIYANPFLNRPINLENLMIATSIEHCLSDVLTSILDSPKPKPLQCSLMSKVWHTRLCHIGHDLMSKMVENNPDYCYLQLPSSSHQSSSCDHCQAIGETLYRPSLFIEASAPLQLVHCQLSSWKIPGMPAAQLYLIFVDDYSRFTWVYFLQATQEEDCSLAEEVSTLLHRFITRSQTNSRKISQIRTYDGLSDWTEEIKSTLEFNRITHHHSDAFRSIVDQTIVALTVITSHLLSQAGLSQSFWTKALAYAVHTLNRVYCWDLCSLWDCRSKSPFERFHGVGHVPDLLYLRSFGCECVLVNRSTNQQERGILLGYTTTKSPSNPKAIYDYQVWAKERIWTVRNGIKFDELSFPANKSMVVTTPPKALKKKKSRKMMDLKSMTKLPITFELDTPPLVEMCRKASSESSSPSRGECIKVLVFDDEEEIEEGKEIEDIEEYDPTEEERTASKRSILSMADLRMAYFPNPLEFTCCTPPKASAALDKVNTFSLFCSPSPSSQSQSYLDSPRSNASREDLLDTIVKLHESNANICQFLNTLASPSSSAGNSPLRMRQIQEIEEFEDDIPLD